MKLLFIGSIFLLSLSGVPLKAQTCSLTTTERETPAPQADAELRSLARQQTAGLADLLLLDQGQAHRLQQALYDELWQLKVQEEAQPAGQPVPASTAQPLLRGYYQRLLRVLRPNQYATLLRLEGAAVMPFAPLAVASRYVPAGRWLGHRPAHRF